MKKTPSIPNRLQITRHSIEKSVLYKMVSLSRLETVLGCDLKNVDKIASITNYRLKKINNRDTQYPIAELQGIHKTIASILAKIELPGYLYSQKGHSFIDNAVAHTGLLPVGKTDLSGFFPSVSEQKITQMFRDLFNCPKKIASTLAKLCSYKGFLPTGSFISGYIAFFCAKNMFDEINKICIARNIKMTVFVDDLTFSGINVNRGFLATVRRVIHKHNFVCKLQKTKFYESRDIKKITGVIIINCEVRVPNSQLNKAFKTTRNIQNKCGDVTKLKKSLIGQKQHQTQIIKRNKSTEQLAQ